MFYVSADGSSWEQTLTQELRIGCTQVDTLTGVTLTVPAFIDGGVKISLIGFTLFLSASKICLL